MTFTEDSTYGLSPDPRWTHGTFSVPDDNDEPITWDMPFIGWATEVRFVDDPQSSKGANSVRVVPMFWDDACHMTTTERDQRSDSGGGVRLVELHPAVTTEDPTGTAAYKQGHFAGYAEGYNQGRHDTETGVTNGPKPPPDTSWLSVANEGGNPR